MSADKQQKYRDQYLVLREEYQRKTKSFLQENPEMNLTVK